MAVVPVAFNKELNKRINTGCSGCLGVVMSLLSLCSPLYIIIQLPSTYSICEVNDMLSKKVNLDQ